jgi:RimJ/RimL family protein N-acetyltransferase
VRRSHEPSDRHSWLIPRLQRRLVELDRTTLGVVYRDLEKTGAVRSDRGFSRNTVWNVHLTLHRTLHRALKNAVEDGLVGFLAYLRITPHDGAIEIGAIVYSRQLQRTTAATEAQYLLLNHAFDSGYRRVEWKCDDLNEPSRRAAVRFGYLYEGTFRMATHYKGRSRDTAWYAITIDRWPQIKRTFEAWLARDNFDDDGNQITTLSNLAT